MTLIWVLILLVVCFAPTTIYLAVTKKCGGEPLVLKDQHK